MYALLFGGLVAGTAWCIDRGAARNNHWSPAKRRVSRWFFYSLAIVTGVFVYFSDAELRGTTLFEASGAWEQTGGRVWTIEVEHPGIVHRLLVFPDIPGPENAKEPITLRVRFGPEGGEPLLDTLSPFEVGGRSGKKPGRTWQSASWSLTPRSAGKHQLLVSAVEKAPPRLHIRLTDPEKRDGRRAPGY